jgi:hypothetical protein
MGNNSNVVPFPGVTSLDTPPERVLEVAAERELDEIVIIGCRKDGGFYFASSFADGGDVIWLLERAKHKLMQITDNLEDGQ